MSKQNYFNLILMFLLLAQRVSAQVTNLPKERIVLFAGGDSSYEKIGVTNNLPTFFPAVKERLTFPLSWLAGSFNDFNIWREEARKMVKQSFLAKPPLAPFNPVIIDRQDRGTYVANKIVMNISGDSRVLGYLLIPKGTGPLRGTPGE